MGDYQEATVLESKGTNHPYSCQLLGTKKEVPDAANHETDQIKTNGTKSDWYQGQMIKWTKNSNDFS